MVVSETHIMAPRLARFGAWSAARTRKLALSCLAVLCCALGLAGSGFDYSVANAAAFSEDGLAGSVDLLAWNGFLGNLLVGSVGVVLAASMVLVLGLWTSPQQSTMKVVPQRQLYDAAD